MTRLYLLLFFTFLFYFVNAQQEWQEHFSHDRTAYQHIGHFVIDGQIVLLMGNSGGPMNTLETITKNTKKEVVVISQSNEYSDIKTTTTGVNEKEILLLNPFDYDIIGEGVHSVRLHDESITTRSIRQINGETPYIYDALIPLDPMQNRHCITESAELLTLNEIGFVITSQELQNVISFHETSGKTFQLSGPTLYAYPSPTEHPIELFLGSYDKIENNPYRNQIAVITQTEMKRYSIENCDLMRTDQLDGEPIDIIFNDQGFYYLTETEQNYTVYSFSDELNQSEVWYELSKEEEILDFKISNFDIINDDIYFLGLIKRPNIAGHFSYVQKRNKNTTFTPKRKDIKLDSLHVVGSVNGTYPWDKWKYDYWFKVTNTNEDTIHHFTVLSPSLDDIGPSPVRYVYDNIAVDLAPGESYEGSGEFSFFELSYLTLRVAGVDFGFDSDGSNNSQTVDIISLSSEDIFKNVFALHPNLSSNMIFLKGDVNDIESLSISNASGQRIEVPIGFTNAIDISNLVNGPYSLEIKTRYNLERHPFIKI